MAANMPMAANGQMMMQQQQQQQQMQQRHQMSQQVLQAIMNSHGTGGAAWHSQVPMQERLGKTLTFISNLLLAMPTADWHHVTSFGIEAEKKAFLTSTDKQAYEATINQQVAELLKRRQEKAPELQNQLTANAARQAQLAQQQHAQQQQQQQLMMNQMRGMGQPGQQPFQHLQHPMQVSQIPQQQAGPGMGMANPAIGQNRPDQRPFGMPTGAQPRVAGVPQTINDLALPREFSQLSAQDRESVIQQAADKFNNASEAEKHQARQAIQARLPPGTQLRDKDPASVFFQQQAFQQFRNSLQQRMMMQQLQQRNPGMPPNALQQQQLQQQLRQQQQAARQQQAGQPNLMNSLGSQPGAGGNQLYANMDAIRNEQQIGMIAQANGLPVVPGNTAGGNPTPGPMNGLPAQPLANMPQGLGQMSRPSMQQPFNPALAQRPQAMNRPPAAPGRPGGLGGPPPNSHSPGMPTINTPMTQPPVPMPQAPGQVPNNQQAAALFNAQFNHQTNARPNALNPQIVSMIASMNPGDRSQVAKQMGLPEDKLQEVLAKWQQQGRNNVISNGTQGLKQHPTPGMGSMLGQPQPGSMANAANQLAMGNNPPQPVGAATTPGLPNNVPPQLLQDPRFAGILANPQSRVSMDSMDAPPQLINQLQGAYGFPPELRKWSQIKQFATANNPQLLPNLSSVQINQFATLWRNKMHQAGKQQQQQQQAMAQERPVQVMPNAAQNTPGPMQAQAQGGVVAPQYAFKFTQQDIERAKMSNPQIAGLPDAQVLVLLQRMKQERARTWAQQQNNLAANKPTAQTEAAPTPQQTTTATLPPTSVTASARSAAPQKLGGVHEPEGSAPASATLKTARPPQSRPTPPNPSPVTAPQKGVKRPNPDDTGDAPSQTTAGAQRPQPQNDGQLLPGQPHRYTPEQIAKLTPDQKAKYTEYMRERQNALYKALQPTKDDEMMVKKLGTEEYQNQQAGRPVPMSQEDTNRTRAKITATLRLISQMRSLLTRHYNLNKDDKKIRLYFRGHFKLLRQFADGDKHTTFREPLTISLAEVEDIYNNVEGIGKDVQTAIQKMSASDGLNQSSIRQQVAPGGNQPPAPAQPQNRPPARSGQPPAAPTTTQPPFALGNQKSPTGEPTYFGAPAVTHANLNPPPQPRKKPKPNPPSQLGQTSSPLVPPGASPQPKVSSPDLRRQPGPAPETTKPQPNPFPCPDAGCEFHQSGFPTEEARNAHHQEEHVKPFEDPLRFFEESIGEWVNSHHTGSPQSRAREQETGQPSSQPMMATLSRTGQTPGGKNESAATPMSRDGSMRRQGSAAGSKAPENTATSGRMVGSKSEETPGPDNSKLVGRLDAEIPMGGPLGEPWANSTIDPQSLFSSFAPMETITGNLSSDFSGYGSSTPNDTPESSKDSGASEPNSDISETANMDIDLNWQPMDESMLVDMSSINMETYDPLSNDFMVAESFQFDGLDDVVTDFSKPFQFDTSLYSMDMM